MANLLSALSDRAQVHNPYDDPIDSGVPGTDVVSEDLSQASRPKLWTYTDTVVWFSFRLTNGLTDNAWVGVSSVVIICRTKRFLRLSTRHGVEPRFDCSYMFVLSLSWQLIGFFI